jgi:hypothetical protein
MEWELLAKHTAKDEMTMKRHETKNTQGRTCREITNSISARAIRAIKKQIPGAIQGSPLERPDSTKVVKTTREQIMDELAPLICKMTGTHSPDVAHRIVCQVGYAQVWPKPADRVDQMAKSVALIGEMAPQNATEAMVAAQMIATNDAALMFVQRSTLEGQTFEGVDANVLRATRLMRLFLQQVEAMQKLKAKASLQNLTVEQVNVHQGGHAIVGAVSTSIEGGEEAA